MIIGVDLGNYAVKTSERCTFISKVSKIGNLLENKLILKNQSGTLYIEEGEFDTEYRKIKKEYIKELLATAICMSTIEINNQIVVGLPLGQYKEDKEQLKNLLLTNRFQDVNLNGIDRKLIIEDVDVYPEGVAALLDKNYEGIVIDIGGRTTDIALIEGKRVQKPFSLSLGTLNLYLDFIKIINCKYSLDLKLDDAPRILKNGLKILGESKDINFAVEVFRNYVETLVKDLQIDYSIKTLDIILVGGGANILYKAFKNRLPQISLIEDSYFANAYGFKRWGESIWQ